MRDCTAASGVMSDMTAGAVTYMMTAMKDMMAMPIVSAILPKERASAGRRAPRLCPTSVVAASAMP